ncbi:aminotransferase class I/II-fold pyridoxal phosphate-dependent enzyme [Clostridium bovifaecis]|uniref:Aminotransferase class I/II-fold pyridoxal phosphate-dependent enzyme n=1 Tax=Clostridium bovifaecis TaxID=2184719 RepID=A0A6I6F139_9CLOT|nr:aminotransferase class I/II-fold pyridoxal phosphate-dependent enzyme [Clostridium bovifaecis]
MRTESLDLENLDSYLDKTIKIVRSYISNIAADPVVPNVGREDLTKLFSYKVPYEGIGIENVLEDVERNVVPYCTKVGSPRFLSWIITSPSPAGTIGEILNLGLNQVPFTFKAGPTATVIEDIVISWFASLFGYSSKSGGILVSGGTNGTLTALTAAREYHVPGTMKEGLQNIKKPLVVYTSAICHKSVETAISVLGIGANFLRKIPVDTNFKMDINKLEEAVNMDIASGYDPFCVVAQAGTSNEGAVDNIDAIADFCNSNNIWLHVDAAYAGGAILTERGKALMKGIHKADSISTDPHKWFFIPAEAGCVLVKDRKHLYNTFRITDIEFKEDAPIEYSNYGIQFTRMSRAFKIWFAFRTYGLDKIRKIIDQNLDLTLEFLRKIEENDSWEVLAPVQTSAICFRYVPSKNLKDADLDKLQMKILRELESTGKAFLAPAIIDGKVTLRACFSNHRTTYEDLNLLFTLLSDIANNLTNQI